MADKETPQAEPQEQSAEKKKSMLMPILFGVALILPAIAGLAVFRFMILPRVAAEEAAITDTETMVEETEEYTPEMQILELPEAQATVTPPNFDAASPLLMYQVALTCANAQTVSVIETYKPMFIALVAKLHRNRTRAELADPFVQETILKQTREEANALLQKLAGKNNNKVPIRVIEAVYVKFTIVDM
ncbi:MAG TPA: hypothetical protein PK349_05385 [Candidatus Hydrogenedentes bacterium]|nr:hypothetical protein [Candidatus Hydrogenedentota bacterium]